MPERSRRGLWTGSRPAGVGSFVACHSPSLSAAAFDWMHKMPKQSFKKAAMANYLVWLQGWQQAAGGYYLENNAWTFLNVWMPRNKRCNRVALWVGSSVVGLWPAACSRLKVKISRPLWHQSRQNLFLIRLSQIPELNESAILNWWSTPLNLVMGVFLSCGGLPVLILTSWM